jgi:hypothetical protein
VKIILLVCFSLSPLAISLASLLDMVEQDIMQFHEAGSPTIERSIG